MGGTSGEATLDGTAIQAVNVLRATVRLRPTDQILEIGCGVGRVGKALARLVSTWTGRDASVQMAEFARTRLAHLPKVSVVEISGHDLKPIADRSLDVVYSTVVFMPLDEWDRSSYVLEAFRVLRPGGRFWCDNTNLCSDEGWEILEDHRLAYAPAARPTHISKSSTPQELSTYLTRAGFTQLQTHDRHLWVDAWGCDASVIPPGRSVP